MKSISEISNQNLSITTEDNLLSSELCYKSKYNECKNYVSNIQNPTINQLNIDFKPYYILSRASFGQIMESFNRISINKPTKSIYQHVIIQWFGKEIPLLIENFESILSHKCSIDYTIKWYSLAVNLPFKLHIMKYKHGKIYLKNAKIGVLVEALKQRLNYILIRETPYRYINDPHQIDHYIDMKKDLQKFKKTIDLFEKNFVEIIDKAFKEQKLYDMNN